MTSRTQDVGDYWSGDSLVLRVEVVDDNGDAVDISNADVEWVLADGSGGTEIVNKTVGDGIEITDPANGELEISIDPQDTDDLSGAYYHECELTDQNGYKSTVFVGQFRINADTIE